MKHKIMSLLILSLLITVGVHAYDHQTTQEYNDHILDIEEDLTLDEAYIDQNLQKSLAPDISKKNDPDTSFDIMYVYTAAAKNRAGGESAIRSKIVNAVKRINETFANSRMNLRANLVHIEEISYPLDRWEWKGDSVMRQRFVDALNHLIGKHDGYMDNVHRLRDKYSADFVQLVISNAAYGGLSYVGNRETKAFSAIGIKMINGSSVHELGHTMGLDHPNGNTGTYTYARGYNTGSIGTVMGKNNVKFWSSPNLSYRGTILGDAQHDAKRALLNNAPIFCNFRKRPIKTAPILTTTLPAEMYSDTLDIEINGTPGYEVYVNNVDYGVVKSDGKFIIHIAGLNIGVNNFEIRLKDTVSGTLSASLSIRIVRKDITPILIPIYSLLLN